MNDNKQENMELNIGEKLTIIAASELGVTYKREIVVRSLTPQITYSIGRKRKIYPLRINEGTLIFRGHDIKIKSDSELSKSELSFFNGDFRVNVGGLPVEKMKSFIQENNINPSFTKWGKIIHYKGNKMGEIGTPLFPDQESNQ